MWTPVTAPAAGAGAGAAREVGRDARMTSRSTGGPGAR